METRLLKGFASVRPLRFIYLHPLDCLDVSFSSEDRLVAV